MSYDLRNVVHERVLVDPYTFGIIETMLEARTRFCDPTWAKEGVQNFIIGFTAFGMRNDP